MQAVRQAGSGLIYAVLSIVLVVGSLSVALAERNVNTPGAATATSSPMPSPTDTPLSSAPAASATQIPAVSEATTPTPSLAALSSTPVVNYPTLAPTRRVPTPTPVARTTCGPLPGWVKAYIVQPGDSMFHIATLYRTTVSALQRANCKTSFLIFAGERLWVPNVSTVTPGVTIIPPFFDTPTQEPTYVFTDTPVYYTPTAVPSETATPGP